MSKQSGRSAERLVGTLAMEAVQNMPKAASKAIAKHLRKSQPAVFTSVEQARSAVRAARGASGRKERKRLKGEIVKRSSQDAKDCRRWGALLPSPERNPWKVHTLSTKAKRWLCLFDVHVPHHSVRAIDLALDFGKKAGCDGIYLGGDIADAYQLSHWERDPRHRSFKKEAESVNKFLDVLEQFQPNAITWKCGNHEYRLERYLMQRAPELFEMEKFTWSTFCELERRGIEWIPSNDPIQVGKLLILHGHELGKGISNPVNPARGAFVRAMECVMVGHHHRSSTHQETTALGKVISCSSIGCLCNLRPAYAPFNKWNWGLATLAVSGRDWELQPYKIINGKVYPC